MILNEISIKNFRSISDLHINLNGKNLQISGQNGSGKSSIFFAYSWCLSTDRLNVSPFDNPNALTSVILNFDDFSVRRSFDPSSNIKNIYSIDKVQKSESDFKLFLGSLSHGLDFKIFSKLDFFNSLSNIARRDILLLLSSIDDQSFCHQFPQFSPILDELASESELKARLKLLKDYLNGIPRELDGLKFNLQPFDENKLYDLNEQLLTINKNIKNSSDSSKIQNNISIIQTKLQNIDDKINEKRNQYSNLKNAHCPYCKQPLPKVHITKLADKLRNEAKSLNDDKSNLQIQLQSLQQNLDSAIDLSILFEQKANLQAQISQLQLAQKSHLRIKELSDSQSKYQAELKDVSNKLALIQDFKLKKISSIADEINSKFQFVTFKLFDFIKSTGEIKPTCEVTLNNIPYQFLSTGEKIKVDLDCLNTLQNHFHLQFPIFIDDFESITSNSIFDLPNQLITLKAVDGQKGLAFDEI